MHIQAENFTKFVKTILPYYFIDKRVLDVGSGDINGNNRYLFENCVYDGNDVIDAKNVTIVSKTKDIGFEDNTFDTIISTECFQHDCEYNESFKKIYKMLKPNGLFLFTCASTGRPEHGTMRSTPFDSYGTLGCLIDMCDYYKNISEEDLNNVLELNELFCVWDTYYNSFTCDLYFLGIKKSDNNDIFTLEKFVHEYVTHTSSKIPKKIKKKQNLLYCLEIIYKPMEDYINSIKKIFAFQLILINYKLDINFNDNNNNYIFIQRIPYYIFEKYDISTFTNIFLINTEQLCRPIENLLFKNINSYPSNVKMIDYSYSNFKYKNDTFKKYLLPYQINYHEIYDFKKSKDICIISDNATYISSPKRQKMVDILKNKGINVDIVTGYLRERDIILFEYKIILNISYSDEYKIFETFRCDRCIYNKMIVISDIKENIDEYYLKDYVLFEEYDKIPDKVCDVINNYDVYYKNLFDDFSFETIEKKLENISSEIKGILCN
jgi:SAM-dependent methyltransferase